MKYRLNDQEARVGPYPWRWRDPKVIAWQVAHNHDIRSKCIAENGCVVIESDLEALEDENERLRAENARLRVENGQLEQVAAGLIREARVE